MDPNGAVAVASVEVEDWHLLQRAAGSESSGGTGGTVISGTASMAFAESVEETGREEHYYGFETTVYWFNSMKSEGITCRRR